MSSRSSVSTALGILLTSGFTPIRADQTTGSSSQPAACQDLVIVMKDDTADQLQPKKMTVFFDCHENNGNLPSATTMNFMIFDAGRLCHGYRVCGNLRGWEGTFKLGGTYYWGSQFHDAFNIADDCGHNDTSCRSYDHPYGHFGIGYPYGGYGSGGRSNVRMDFITKFSNIDRHCGALQQYQCLELPSLPQVPRK